MPNAREPAAPARPRAAVRDDDARPAAVQPEALARLARIRMTPLEAESYAAQLARILELVERMNRIDTDGVAPMSHPQDGALRLGDDDARADDRREAYQRIAPATERGLYLVPKVIE
ncbi:MAG: Asp-tRNA(Asn)/Glu-tRNA(Gln) amidotransferase subunit GatC [bacterium]